MSREITEALVAVAALATALLNLCAAVLRLREAEQTRSREHPAPSRHCGTLELHGAFLLRPGRVSARW
ncbi:MAG: hypothetical protein DI611_15195 [Brachybacterium faecium]|nr:MAG: hypothetical protein DI611_15195 [Brachybacterium faecium]